MREEVSFKMTYRFVCDSSALKILKETNKNVCVRVRIRMTVCVLTSIRVLVLKALKGVRHYDDGSNGTERFYVN